jgi:hypothetical protein
VKKTNRKERGKMKKHIALFSTTLLFASFLGGARAFADERTEANPQSAQTTVTGQLQLSEDGGFNPNPPSKGLNKKTSIGEDSYFGIAYTPETFNIGTVALADTSVEQSIVMQGPTGTEGDNKSFHIAVKDKLRDSNRTWTLKAKLTEAIENNNLGITIKTGTEANTVKRNMNNGSEDFKPTDLIDQVKKDNEIEVTNQANLIISTTEADVMKAVSGKFVNGAYDLELPQVELNIPNPDKVKAQQVNTTVTWTLSDTPA